MRGLLYIRFVLDIFYLFHFILSGSSCFLDLRIYISCRRYCSSPFSNIYCASAYALKLRHSAICTNSIHIYCSCFIHFFFVFLPCPLLLGTAQPPRPFAAQVPFPRPSFAGMPFLAIISVLCLSNA